LSYPYRALLEQLAQIEGERLRREVASAAAELRQSKTFGLVFEEHASRRRPRCRAFRAHESAEVSRAERFSKYFGEWWMLMAMYGLGLLGLGVLLTTGHATDTWVYAVGIAVGVNVFKLFRSNSLTVAPYVRGNLGRSIFVLRRESSGRLQRATSLAGPGNEPLRIDPRRPQ
jgi:hypothetical protein